MRSSSQTSSTDSVAHSTVPVVMSSPANSTRIDANALGAEEVFVESSLDIPCTSYYENAPLAGEQAAAEVAQPNTESCLATVDTNAITRAVLNTWSVNGQRDIVNGGDCLYQQQGSTTAVAW